MFYWRIYASLGLNNVTVLIGSNREIAYPINYTDVYELLSLIVVILWFILLVHIHIKFHWNMFRGGGGGVQLMINHLLFRWWLGVEQATHTPIKHQIMLHPICFQVFIVSCLTYAEDSMIIRKVVYGKSNKHETITLGVGGSILLCKWLAARETCVMSISENKLFSLR